MTDPRLVHLADAPPADRSERGREAVRAVGARVAAKLTDGWGLAPRPGFVHGSKHGALPGVIRCLLEAGAVAEGASGLALLSWLVAGAANGLTVVPEQPGGRRLDQQGWPCNNDARLALRAVEQLTCVPPLLEDSVRKLRAYLGGDLALAAELEAIHAAAAYACFVGSGASAEEAMVMVERLVDRAAVASMKPLASRLAAAPTELGAAPKALEAIWFLAMSTQAAADGWTAFHAHRGLPSGAAQAAAATVQAASSATGAVSAEEVVYWALELAALPDDNVSGSGLGCGIEAREARAGLALANRPSTVELFWPESERAFSVGLAAVLRHKGHKVHEHEVRGYPLADSLVCFCQRALEDCDLLLMVLTADQGSSWLRHEIRTQLGLAFVRPKVALLLRGGQAQPSPGMAVIDLGDGSAPEPAIARLDDMLTRQG